MNNKSEKEEIKGYISFKIDLNKYTDDLYDDMDYEICGEVEPIQISIYNDSSLNKSDHISNQIQAIATDTSSEVFEAIKEMRAAAQSYYFEDENIGGEEAIFIADLWFCEKGKEVYSNGTYIRNTGVPPLGLKFPLYEIFEDVHYDDDCWTDQDSNKIQQTVHENHQHLASFIIFYGEFLSYGEKKEPDDPLNAVKKLIYKWKIILEEDKDHNDSEALELYEKIREGIKTYEDGFLKIGQTISNLKLDDNQILTFVKACVEMYLFSNSSDGKFTGDELVSDDEVNYRFYKGYDAETKKTFENLKFLKIINDSIGDDKVVKFFLDMIMNQLNQQKAEENRRKNQKEVISKAEDLVNTTWKLTGDIGFTKPVDAINVTFLDEGKFQYQKFLDGKVYGELGVFKYLSWKLDNSSIHLSFSASDFTVLRGKLDSEKITMKGKNYQQGVSQNDWVGKKIEIEELEPYVEKVEDDAMMELQIDDIFNSIFSEDWKEEDYPYDTIAYEIKNNLFFETEVSVELANWIEEDGYGCDRPNQISEGEENYDPNGNEVIKIYADSYIDHNFKNDFLGFFNDEDYFDVKLTKNEVEYWIEKSIESALDFFNNFSVSSIENGAPEDLFLDLVYNKKIDLKDINNQWGGNSFTIKRNVRIPEKPMPF